MDVPDHYQERFVSVIHILGMSGLTRHRMNTGAGAAPDRASKFRRQNPVDAGINAREIPPGEEECG